MSSANRARAGSMPWTAQIARVGRRIGLGHVIHRVDVVHAVEGVGEAEPVEHPARIILAGIGEDELAPGQRDRARRPAPDRRRQPGEIDVVDEIEEIVRDRCHGSPSARPAWCRGHGNRPSAPAAPRPRRRRAAAGYSRPCGCRSKLEQVGRGRIEAVVEIEDPAFDVGDRPGVMRRALAQAPTRRQSRSVALRLQDQDVQVAVGRQLRRRISNRVGLIRRTPSPQKLTRLLRPALVDDQPEIADRRAPVGAGGEDVAADSAVSDIRRLAVAARHPVDARRGNRRRCSSARCCGPALCRSRIVGPASAVVSGAAGAGAVVVLDEEVAAGREDLVPIPGLAHRPDRRERAVRRRDRHTARPGRARAAAAARAGGRPVERS